MAATFEQGPAGARPGRRVPSRTIVWPNGLDPDPDMLHDEYPAARQTSRHQASPAAAA
ncbi:MAG: hypothetical protein ACRDK7_09535 [Solirubrobacteraceae bacterium]